MRSLVTAILSAALLLGANAPFSPAMAAPASANTLTAVSFTPKKESMELVFRSRDALTADQVSVSAAADDVEVLNVHLDGIEVTRRWVTLPDAQIERALLHPGQGTANSAVLRIRLKRAVTPAVLDAVKIHDADGAVVVILPRNDEVAAAWTAAEKAPVAAAAAVKAPATPASVAAAPAPGSATPISAAATPASAPASLALAPVVTPVTAAVKVTPVTAAGPADAKTSTVADTALTLGDDSPASPSLDAGENVVANAGVSDNTGVGAAAVTLFLLLGGGFLLWRKIRGHRTDGGTGRLIRPLSTHVLGPKQGLLLLDVAGEMVLLGTSEKGVQMLTKIERSPESHAAMSAPAARAAVAETRTHAANQELDLLRSTEAPAAPRTPGKMNVAERANAAIAKVRALSESRKQARLETADEDVSADSLERAFFDRADEHLAEAANGVEDDFDPRPENFFARLRKAAERPETPAEPAVKTPTPRAKTPTVAAKRPEAAPMAARTSAPASRGDDPMTHDILRKIRALQGV